MEKGGGNFLRRPLPLVAGSRPREHQRLNPDRGNSTSIKNCWPCESTTCQRYASLFRRKAAACVVGGPVSNAETVTWWERVSFFLNQTLESCGLLYKHCHKFELIGNFGSDLDIRKLGGIAVVYFHCFLVHVHYASESTTKDIERPLGVPLE